jgi:hypothetical protein
MSRDSLVSIVTGYGLDSGVNIWAPVGSRIISISSSLALRPTQSPVPWVQGALSPGVKQQGRKADHSPPATAEVKRMCINTAAIPYPLMV